MQASDAQQVQAGQKPGGGGGLLPYMGYMGMCCCEG